MNEREMGVVAAGLMPHAPVLIPVVAGERELEVASSITAMRNLSRQVLARHPGRMILISPHSPRKAGSFGVWETDPLEGTLASFGCPKVGVSLPNDPELIAALKEKAGSSGVSLWPIRDRTLDHGAIVPLYFLVEAGWTGPTTVVSLNYPGEGGLEELGEDLRQAVLGIGGSALVMASGDMSHCLKHDAPAGYRPEGRQFDETFVSLLQGGCYAELKRLDPETVEQASEDVVDSTRVALGAVGYRNTRHEVLSYEGPFGVGYCVAMLYQAYDGHE